MKQTMKGFVAGFVACGLLSATVAFAAGGVMKEIFYGVNVVADGKTVQFADDARPFTMEGRTYLPVRAIGEALGRSVDYDSSSSTVYIKGAQETATQAPAPAPATTQRIFLSDLTPIQKSSVEIAVWTINDKDNFGNKYSSGYKLDTGFSGDPSITFAVDKYNSLTATITPARTGNDRSSRVAFYSVTDIGTKKIYETDEITPLTRPFTITVPLSGVSNLMIEGQEVIGYGVSVGVVDAYLE